MRWKVNMLLLCTFMVSIYAQVATIGENLYNPINKTIDSGIIEVSTTTDNTIENNKNQENEGFANDNAGNGRVDGDVSNLDRPSSDDLMPSTEETQPSNDEVNTWNENNQPSNEETQTSDEETNPSTEDTQLSNEETQTSNENTQTSNENTQPSNENTQPSNENTQPSNEVVQPSNEVIQTSKESAAAGSSEEILIGGIITTTNGPVQGYQWKESLDIISYIDIPYGRVSSFFQAPELPVSWEETHHVPIHSKRCPQIQINEETRNVEVAVEHIDCLTLSVFTPREVENASVLFHIHDGSFTSGSGDPLIYGPEHLVSKGIILVLPNYRLGPLGFLCLQNETAPGNAALKDLTLALNWTKENIAAFGGNPDNIVVSGDGKSGALAGYLAISPVSKDYVSKVITESGSVVSHWAIDRDPVTTATVLAEKIRSSYKDHEFNDDLFSEIDMEKLFLEAQGIHLSPCIEETESDSFISHSPWYIINSKKNIIKPFMMGSASFAGLHEAFSHNANSISQLNEDFSYFMPNDLVFEDGKVESLEVANKIKGHHFGEDDIKENSKELALAYTDAWYLSPALRAARVLVKAGATVYFYEFAFVGELNRERVALGSEVNGSARGDIVGYLFTQGGQLAEEGSKEDEMIALMTDLWISFIEDGTPTSSHVEWNQLETTSEEEEEWLWIGAETQARKGVHVDRLQLWTDIYEEYFVERNLAHGISRNPALIVAAISIVGLFPKSMSR